MKFKQWFETFLEEKGLDLDNTVIEFTNDKGIWNYMTLGTIYEYILDLPHDIQDQFKEKIVIIDFHNGDIMHFFKYIANYISNLISFF
ncbi:MAG: hypothetical protein ACFE8J_04065 [Candidatus Heimdallarchaeota archaeon]